MDSLFTNTQEEKVYAVNNESTKEEMESNVSQFFEELKQRKFGGSLEEGGLQSVAVIFPNCFGAKINENDGTALHNITRANVARYLCGKKGFYPNDAVMPALYSEEYRKIDTEGIAVSMICNEAFLFLMITTEQQIQTEFEREVLRCFMEQTKKCFEKGYFKDILFGMKVGNETTQFDTWDDSNYDRILNMLGCEKVKFGK